MKDRILFWFVFSFIKLSMLTQKINVKSYSNSFSYLDCPSFPCSFVSRPAWLNTAPPALSCSSPCPLARWQFGTCSLLATRRMKRLLCDHSRWHLGICFDSLKKLNIYSKNFISYFKIQTWIEAFRERSDTSLIAKRAHDKSSLSFRLFGSRPAA